MDTDSTDLLVYYALALAFAGVVAVALGLLMRGPPPGTPIARHDGEAGRVDPRWYYVRVGIVCFLFAALCIAAHVAFRVTGNPFERDPYWRRASVGYERYSEARFSALEQRLDVEARAQEKAQAEVLAAVRAICARPTVVTMAPGGSRTVVVAQPVSRQNIAFAALGSVMLGAGVCLWLGGASWLWSEIRARREGRRGEDVA